MRKFLRGVVIVLLALTVLQMADWMFSSDGRPPIFVCLIVLGLVWLSWKSASKASLREIPKDFDSDGGIDWQEKSVNGQVYQRSGQWVLMVPDIAVYETDELCARLTDAGVRFRLEGSSRNPEYSHWGRGGLQSRMRLCVQEWDVERAKPIIDKQLKISV